jgi:hypothetical protein
MARPHKRERGVHDIIALVRHAAAVIEEETDRGRSIFRLENFDLLFAAVFVNPEILFSQTGYRPPILVEHRNVEHDQIDIDGKRELKEKKKS